MAHRFAFAVLTLAAASPLVAKDGSTARAREVLRSSGCGSCHDSGVSAKNQAALAVYDLVEAEWPARMSDEQLPRLLGRLKSAPAGDRKIVREFIATELKTRALHRR
jgi:formate dehydrogenase assembly factor FdhD